MKVWRHWCDVHASEVRGRMIMRGTFQPFCLGFARGYPALANRSHSWTFLGLADGPQSKPAGCEISLRRNSSIFHLRVSNILLRSFRRVFLEKHGPIPYIFNFCIQWARYFSIKDFYFSSIFYKRWAEKGRISGCRTFSQCEWWKSLGRGLERRRSRLCKLRFPIEWIEAIGQGRCRCTSDASVR